MRVIVGCEFSGTVRDAFAVRGHYARSVDLLPSERLSSVRFRAEFGCYEHETATNGCEECEYGEPFCHLHGMDAAECPCLGPTEDEVEYDQTGIRGARHLSGDLFSIDFTREYFDLGIFHWPCTRLANSGVRWLAERDLWWEMEQSALAFRRLLELPIPRIVVENPIPHKYALEIIGTKYSQIIQPWQFGHGETKATCLWLKGVPPLVPTKIVKGREGRIHKLPPSADRWKVRSKTYQGIADAMAEQWGRLAQERAA